MKYKVDNGINVTIKNLIDSAIKGEIDMPNNSLILNIAEDSISAIITKKRLEIIDVIKKRNPKSIVELANILNRKLQAVDRDLKLLEQYGLVSLIRKGKTAIPVVDKEIIIIPLIRPQSLDRIRNKKVSRIKEEFLQLTVEERKKLLKDILHEQENLIAG